MPQFPRLDAYLRRRPTPDSWIPSPVVRALRRPAFYWTLVALLTVFTLWSINDLTSSARATLEGYGTSERVLVITAPIVPGGALDGSVEYRDVPTALVPEGAVRSMPADPVARVELFPGEVVVNSRLAGGGSGIATLVPDGSTALAVPAGLALPPVVVGDLVDVIATFAVAPEQADEASFAVARRASVVHVADNAVTVAVDRPEAAAVAFALTHGNVTLALVG